MDTKEMTHVVASPEASDHKQEPAHEQGPPIDPGHHPPPSAPPASGGKRMVGVLLGIALVAGLLGVGIAPRLRQGQKLAADAAVMTSSVPLVNVINPHPAPSTTDIVLPGNVQAIEQTTINARTSGYLRRRYVDIGS